MSEILELWEQDPELNRKIAEIKVQHEIDKFFDMKTYNFFDGLSELPEKRNHAPRNMEYPSYEKRYGTHEEQTSRINSYWSWIFNDIKNGNKEK